MAVDQVALAPGRATRRVPCPDHNIVPPVAIDIPRDRQAAAGVVTVQHACEGGPLQRASQVTQVQRTGEWVAGRLAVNQVGLAMAVGVHCADQEVVHPVAVDIASAGDGQAGKPIFHIPVEGGSSYRATHVSQVDGARDRTAAPLPVDQVVLTPVAIHTA